MVEQSINEKLKNASWVLTYTGKAFYPFAPSAEMVAFEDIAHALSNICRFNGATRGFYSVAEHSVIVSHLVPQEYALEALLHDAAEAYIGDLPAPFKHFFPDFEKVELGILTTIFTKYSIRPTIESMKAVRQADLNVLELEKQQAVRETELPWETGGFAPPYRLYFHSARFAKDLFTRRFYELCQLREEGVINV